MENQENVKQSIREWWASYPMTYGLEHGLTTYTKEDGTVVKVEIGTREFFEIADKTFYSWNTAKHDETGYFGKIFDYASYAGKPVLEVGCGMGCMAMNWASHGANITAVDLNPVAIAITKKRFESFNLTGDIREADGEKLPFDDNSFDYVYSWGVLHHSPNTKKSISELFRVLKPGGKVGVMLYHRNSMMFRFWVEYLEGFLHMENEFLSPLELASRYGDGERKEGNPHTWPVTKNEVYADLFMQYTNVQIDVLGTELVFIFNQWFPGLATKLPPKLMKACIRRWGWSLWITGEK
jgi:2-polyprenyl-3-methyl-5-hydroxy-6-metoxy-1,4-benzoquinol methylase